MVNQIDEAKTRRSTLLQQATQVTNQIAERIRDWEIFKHKMEKVSDWLYETQGELKEITCFYRFLADFQPVLDRYTVSIIM